MSDISPLKKKILYSVGETYSAVTGKKLVFITSLKDVPPLIVAENKTIPILLSHKVLYTVQYSALGAHIVLYIHTPINHPNSWRRKLPDL